MVARDQASVFDHGGGRDDGVRGLDAVPAFEGNGLTRYPFVYRNDRESRQQRLYAGFVLTGQPGEAEQFNLGDD